MYLKKIQYYVIQQLKTVSKVIVSVVNLRIYKKLNSENLLPLIIPKYSNKHYPWKSVHNICFYIQQKGIAKPYNFTFENK